ncbi:hypothetical protein MHBO_000456 [Bonamia ostreae]|uniref:Uncharacterized protein n=1 Tax=Bonamia ostreae TaxID=126728 RepID=A0ABV2AFQ2_9EUKA
MLVFLSNLGENDLNPFINLIFAHLNAEKLNKTKNGKIEHKKPNLNKITKILTDFAKYFKKETKVHFGRFFDIAQTVFVKVLNGDEKKTKSLIFSLLIDYLDKFI